MVRINREFNCIGYPAKAHRRLAVIIDEITFAGNGTAPASRLLPQPALWLA